MLISYAQNFEDVMLRRALSHIDRGFYVDVGAQHPVIHSVSLAFYEKGWRGVHVEPSATYAAMLRKARPDEEVMQVAVGERDGFLVFHEIPETGLSTVDAAVAARHQRSGYAVTDSTVPCVTLDTILSRYSDRDVHWLKVDVEGHERSVIAGWSGRQPRPWIILLESTAPLTQDDVSGTWEPLLKALDYEFAYFDGINRFYVAAEHRDLKPALAAPPNYFDDFSVTLHSDFARKPSEELHALQAGLSDLRRLHETTEAELRVRETRIGELGQTVAYRNARILELEQARSASVAQADALRAELADLERRHEQAEAESSARVLALSQARSAAEAQVATLQDQLATVNALYQAIERSRSWRFTLPLRILGGKARSAGSAFGAAWGSLQGMPRNALRRLMLAGWRQVEARPGARSRLARLLAGFPGMDRRARALAQQQRGLESTAVRMPPSQPASCQLPSAVPPLPAESQHAWPRSVRRAYDDLVRARARQVANAGCEGRGARGGR